MNTCTNPTTRQPNASSRLQNKTMEFTIEPATPSDAEELTAVFQKCFADDFNRQLFPRTADVRDWWIKTFAHFASEAESQGTSALLKVVATSPDPDKEPVIAAFAKWDLPVPSGVPEEGHGGEAWPGSSDKELCDLFFGGMEAERKRVVGDQPHYYLDMLGTNPEFNRRGLGARLLKWGLDRADRDGVVTYLSSSPAGRPLYERNGFEAVREYEVIPGYSQTTMLRPVVRP